MHIYR
jgi:hypothetical protein